MDTSNIHAIPIQADKTTVPAPIAKERTDQQLNGLKATNQEANPLKPKANQNTQSAKTKSNSEELQQISDKLQRMFDAELDFTVDEKSGEHVIKVIDKATKEVLRQIPSEEALQIRESIAKFRKGLLVNLKT